MRNRNFAVLFQAAAVTILKICFINFHFDTTPSSRTRLANPGNLVTLTLFRPPHPSPRFSLVLSLQSLNSHNLPGEVANAV